MFNVESRLGVEEGRGGRESTEGVLVADDVVGDIMCDEVEEEARVEKELEIL